MVRAFVILLAFFYTISATGATAYLLDCCGAFGKLLMHDEQDTVSCCMDSNENSCDHFQARHCKDVKIEAKKTTAEHLPSTDHKLLKIYPFERWTSLLNVVGDPLPDSYLTFWVIDAPPEPTATPLFIRHCTYRI